MRPANAGSNEVVSGSRPGTSSRGDGMEKVEDVKEGLKACVPW